jgi:quercetin dioxygenase-like cupin family protein
LAESDTIDTPRDLVDLVQYQEGAIVSRVLAKDSSGTVTAFAFDAGQDLSEHTTPFDALLYLFDGTATITIAGTSHQLNCSQIIRLPARVPHAVKAVDRFKMLLVMLRST